MSEDNYRVRYGRVTNSKLTKTENTNFKNNTVPKNTLITYRVGDAVYFGISRCNKNLDVFNKYLGKKIAIDRAVLAQNDSSDTSRSEENLTVHSSGLRGYTDINNIKNLIEYFYNIDKISLNNNINKEWMWQ